MAAIVYKKFAGEIPNAEPHLLPEDRAQFAQNCEFTTGSLSPMKDGFFIKTLSNSGGIIKSLYTEDGVGFFTWPSLTYAYRGPVIGDVFNRVYFLQPGGAIKVTSATTISSTHTLGGQPGTSYSAGVPRPILAPVLETISRTTLPDNPNATVSIEWWYEYAGTQYQRTTAAVTAVTPLQQYTFTVAAKTPSDAEGKGGTPAEAVLNAKFKFTDAGKDLMTVSPKVGVDARSGAFPGGIEVSLQLNNLAATLNLTWANYETRAYVYTYENTDWLEQGPPSPPSTISVSYIQDVKITVETSPPTTLPNMKPLRRVVVYRTFGTGTSYLEVKFEYPVSGLAVNQGVERSMASRGAGTALKSADWTPPPLNLDGLVLAPNGWFAAYKDNTLYMSEPYRPHAWPYSMSFSKSIRGIAVSQQSIVVTTSDGVHVVSGSFPGSAQSIRLALPQAGISQKSMTQVDGAVAYASRDGLVFVSGTEASLAVSQKLFSRKKWQELYGGILNTIDMTLAYHDGCLVANSGSVALGGFTIRFDEDSGSFSRSSQGYDSMFYLPVADSLYYSIGSNVYQFKGGSSSMQLAWQGRDWIYSGHVTFGAGFLRATGVMRVELFADGVSVYNQVLQPGYFRLPSLPRALRWSVRLSGSSTVSELAIAQTMGELKGV